MDKYMSPEGLEEAVEQQFNFMVTLTQGEKHRLYVKAGPSAPWMPALSCFNTEAEARAALGQRMIMIGSFLHDPEHTLEVLLKALKKEA